MYIHLGSETGINEKDIIGIFDLDSTTVSKHTRNFLYLKEKKKEVINVSYDLPKSFILCGNRKESKVYISQISSGTLQKRSGDINIY